MIHLDTTESPNKNHQLTEAMTSHKGDLASWHFSGKFGWIYPRQSRCLLFNYQKKHHEKIMERWRAGSSCHPEFQTISFFTSQLRCHTRNVTSENGRALRNRIPIIAVTESDVRSSESTEKRCLFQCHDQHLPRTYQGVLPPVGPSEMYSCGENPPNNLVSLAYPTQQSGNMEGKEGRKRTRRPFNSHQLSFLEDLGNLQERLAKQQQKTWIRPMFSA